MNPLDLLKIKFQVNTGKQAGTIGKQMWLSLREVQQTQGWKGLYRGIGPNIAGNASSWGLYFLLCVLSTSPALPNHRTRRTTGSNSTTWPYSYNMLKKQASGGDITKPLSASEYLICSAEASAANLNSSPGTAS